MSAIPEQFCGVTILTKANLYFEGKVVSHSVEFPDGSKKTLGLIYPGKFHFGTNLAERMEIVAGHCDVRIDGAGVTRGFGVGERFEVPAKSGFDIEVSADICEYICTFLSA